MTHSTDNLPLFCWSTDDAHRIAGRPLGKYLIPFQHLYFIIFTPFLRFIWCLSSLLFVRTIPASPSKAIRGKFWVEFILMSMFYTWYVTFMLKICPTWSIMAYHFVISYVRASSISRGVQDWHSHSIFFKTQGIAGAALALIVFMNHYACELFVPASREQLSFVELQLYTTRNIKPGVVMDWFAGGLNYQIEHHLFPTMPRCNLNAASKLVKEFCAQNDIPYMCEDMYTCLKYVHERLYEVAMYARKLNLKQA
jgi:delta8-fatty-acid desaturase